MRYLPIILVSTILASCQVSSTKAVNEQKGNNLKILCLTHFVTVSNMEIDSMPFIMLKMNNETAYISMVDSVIPSETDSTIGLCVEAAFTGELLKEFKTTNIGGDYVIDGVFHKGYKCKANTGFLYADKKIYTISSSQHCDEWIAKAQEMEAPSSNKF